MMAFSLSHIITAPIFSVTGKKYFWWLALALLFSPFLLLAFYNHPSADDYYYTVSTLKLGFWQAQYESYMTWTGRYAATFFLVSNPLVFGSYLGYQFINSLLLLLTAVSGLFFVKTLLHRTTIDLSVLAVSFLFLFLYLSKMPALTEGFFWLAGAITYQLANIATLTLLAWLLQQAEYQKRKWKLVGPILLCVLICGLNETSMIELVYILVGLLVFKYVSPHKVTYDHYILLGVSLAALCIVMLAPGNEVRASYFTGNKDFVRSLMYAVGTSFIRLKDWLPDVLILLILFIPFLKQTASERTVTASVLIMYPLFIFGLLVIGYFPAFWSMGGAPPDRTLNVLYFLFLSACLHYATLCICYASQTDNLWMQIPGYVQWILAFILIVHLAPVNNFRTAVMDLVSGRAREYDYEMQLRYQDLHQSKGEDVTLKALRVKPKSVFLTDIEPLHPADWKNVSMAEYFHVKSLNLTNE